MRALSKNAIIGYPAGIITGVTYGLNPLFAIPLMNKGASIASILFFRYSFAVIILAAFLLLSRQSFKVSWKQSGILFVLGLLYTASSIFLFEAYNYIASGLATTLIFLYPVLVAIIMVFLRVVPSLPVWIAIVATFVGVIIMTKGSDGETINPIGVALSLGSAFVYALFIVIINRSKAIARISNSLLTFYTLSVGAIIFFGKTALSGTAITANISGWTDWLNLIGLALLPTIVSTATLAISTRNIGATKASVLGVLKLANKDHNPNSYSGMGRAYLRKNVVAGVNVLTQSMMPWPNTIYIIQYDYDLQGEEITIPEGCVLDFQGGTIFNGNVNLSGTRIQPDGCSYQRAWLKWHLCCICSIRPKHIHTLLLLPGA